VSNPLSVAIVGAGPFGLSIAAYLRHAKIDHRIFGSPMQSWRTMMPRGMFLKSEGFASNLYDPEESFTLGHFCRETERPYADLGETFIEYGAEFQRRLVPALEPVDIASLKRARDGYELATAAGEKLVARRVVVATGISASAYLPPVLERLPREFVTHSSAHADLSRFRDRQVVVVGAGASAVDIAAILHEGGAKVELTGRAPRVEFHDPSQEPRPLIERILSPRSGLGIGWRSRLCTDAPMVFHAMPERFRLRIVKRHLGPAPGWFVKAKMIGKVPMHMGLTLSGAEMRDGRVHLQLTGAGGAKELVADHVIAGTGYRPSLDRLPFLDPGLRRSIADLVGTPVLTQSFESSAPGLYFVGLASANAFGPLMRFAFGAGYTAKRLTRHLARRAA
jgi:hypothetical protein